MRNGNTQINRNAQQKQENTEKQKHTTKTEKQKQTHTSIRKTNKQRNIPW